MTKGDARTSPFLFPVMNTTSLSIIIISYNTCDLTLGCIGSLQQTCSLPFSLVVVDNHSTDGTVEAIRLKYPEVQIIESAKNSGYAAAVNTGIRSTESEICLVTNADVKFLQHAVEALYEFISSTPDVGVAGLQQIYPDGSWQRSFGLYPGLKAGLYDVFGVNSLINKREKLRFNTGKSRNIPKEVEYVDGAIFMTRRTAFDDVGGFDEGFFFYSEETDYCYRLRKKGWKNVFCPWIRSEHVRGASSSSLPGKESIQLLIDGQIRFINKHSGKSVLRLYMITELLYFSIGGAISIIISAYKKNTEFWKRKRKVYALFSRAWKNALSDI